MIIPKKLPDKGDIVLIKINKVMRYGAYCELVEYKMDAYLPIGEVASGWIKNIHEFIREGQKDAAKVSFIDPVKNTVDISLKKVTTKEKKDKINDHNLEKRAEKIFNNAIVASKLEAKKQEMLAAIAQKVPTYTELITLIHENKEVLPKGTDPKFKKILEELVEKSIRPRIYQVSYTVDLQSFDMKRGISLIKSVLAEVEKAGVAVLYIGAPHYQFTSEGSDYPTAESKIKAAEKILEAHRELSFSMKSNKV